MDSIELRGFLDSLGQDQRAELFGMLLELADADPSGSEKNSVTEATERRAEIESGEVIALSEEEFWSGLQSVE